MPRCTDVIELDIVFFVCAGGLENYFLSFGEVTACSIIRDKPSYASRCVKRGLEHTTLWDRLDKILFVHYHAEGSAT